MKKLTFCLIIIFLFSVFVYWKGLSQRRIEPDTFGILQTKTSGLIEKPLLPGEKNWQWQYLLPTNTVLKTFSIEPQVSSQTVCGELPSGSVYAAIYSSSASFEYQFTFNIAVTISPEAVVELYKLNQITDNETLKVYLDCAGKTLAQLAANYILEKAENNPEFRIESLRKDEILKNVRIYKEFPEVEVYSLSIESSKIPDFSLYKKLKNDYYPQSLNTNTNTITQEDNND